MKDKLDIYEDRDIYEDHYQYRIAWFLGDEDGEMGVLGEGRERFTQKQLDKAPPESWERIKAHLVLQQMKDETRECDTTGYYWESVSAAKKALVLIRTALRDKSNKPWPQWALEAKAAKWTPPKGWTP